MADQIPDPQFFSTSSQVLRLRLDHITGFLTSLADKEPVGKWPSTFTEANSVHVRARGCVQSLFILPFIYHASKHGAHIFTPGKGTVSLVFTQIASPKLGMLGDQRPVSHHGNQLGP